MSQIDVAQFRLMLVGPKVARLGPFFAARGYVAEAATSGGEGLQALREMPRHLLIVEVELGDMLCADLLQIVQSENLAGAIVLLEDPAKSGLVVSTLVRGIDAYVATPPNEAFLFRVIERQLLAQWALAQPSGIASSVDVNRVQQQLEFERSKALELEAEIDALRNEFASLRASAQLAALARNQSTPSPVVTNDHGGATRTDFNVNVPAVSDMNLSSVRSMDVFSVLEEREESRTAPSRPGSVGAGMISFEDESLTAPALSRLLRRGPAQGKLENALRDPAAPKPPPAAAHEDDEFNVPTTQAEMVQVTTRKHIKASVPEIPDRESVTQAELRIPPAQRSGQRGSAGKSGGAGSPKGPVLDERTAPAGWAIPAEFKDLQAEQDGKSRARAAPRLAPGVPPEAELDSSLLDDSSDLFMDMEDDGEHTITIATREPKQVSLPRASTKSTDKQPAAHLRTLEEELDLGALGDLGLDED